MTSLIGFVLDIVLIGFLIAGISYAIKLTQQLADMRAQRADMERFVAVFSSTVERAEAGIRGLKSVSRSSGDDLERLIEKGQSLRDELHFLTESADQIATRLSNTATQMTRGSEAATTTSPEIKPKASAAKQPEKPRIVEAVPSQPVSAAPQQASSAAERDLLRVLGKRG
ncbi:MAG: DUF6468 domain-containing protein [Bdellovibrionales bacterium]|jgi:hypothetical protein